MIFNYFGNIFHYGPWMAKKLVAPQLSITEPCWALTWSPTHHMAEFSPRFRTTTSRVSFPNPHCFFFGPWFWDIVLFFWLGSPFTPLGGTFHFLLREFSCQFFANAGCKPCFNRIWSPGIYCWCWSNPGSQLIGSLLHLFICMISFDIIFTGFIQTASNISNCYL